MDVSALGTQPVTLRSNSVAGATDPGVVIGSLTRAGVTYFLSLRTGGGAGVTGFEATAWAGNEWRNAVYVHRWASSVPGGNTLLVARVVEGGVFSDPAKGLYVRVAKIDLAANSAVVYLTPA
jgi:hypothetical protein